MSATKNHSKADKRRDHGQAGRRSTDVPAGKPGSAEPEAVIPIHLTGSESRGHDSASPQSAASTAPILPLSQSAIELPLDELSETAISALLRSAGSAGRQAACLWFRTRKNCIVEEVHGRAVGHKLIKVVEIRLRNCLRGDYVL